MATAVNFLVLDLREHAGGCSFQVRVHPRAKRNAIVGELDGALKISLTAPPVEGKANDACIDFLAKLLKAPKSSFSIARGETSRNKVIRVLGISGDGIRERLQAALEKQGLEAQPLRTQRATKES